MKANDKKGMNIIGSYELVPVPDHGRLVEADAVVEQIDAWLDSVGYANIGKSLSYYGELLGCIQDAPTIIPADLSHTVDISEKWENVTQQQAALNMAYQRGRYDEQKRMFAEPLTNYSQVTRKSPEELAEWLDGTFRAAEWCDISKFPNEDCMEVPCYGCILEWLKREATDGQT